LEVSVLADLRKAKVRFGVVRAPYRCSCCGVQGHTRASCPTARAAPSPPPAPSAQVIPLDPLAPRFHRQPNYFAKDAAITREERRSRRAREIRARTVSVRQMTKRELELGRLLYPDQGEQAERPRTRGECKDGARPCPWVSCRYHLYLDVSPDTGSVKLNFPDIEVDELVESCSLDVADHGGETLEAVGAIMNLTRERIRQVEVRALALVEHARETKALRDYVDAGPDGKRRLPLLPPEAGWLDGAELDLVAPEIAAAEDLG
jgi:sigma-70-like protein